MCAAALGKPPSVGLRLPPSPPLDSVFLTCLFFLIFVCFSCPLFSSYALLSALAFTVSGDGRSHTYWGANIYGPDRLRHAFECSSFFN